MIFRLELQSEPAVQNAKTFANLIIIINRKLEAVHFGVTRMKTQPSSTTQINH